jgi:hypothetical protein
MVSAVIAALPLQSPAQYTAGPGSRMREPILFLHRILRHVVLFHVVGEGTRRKGDDQTNRELPDNSMPFLIELSS